MLRQKLTADQNTNSGTITITAEAGNLAELLGLYEELGLRISIENESPEITEMQTGTPPPPM